MSDTQKFVYIFDDDKHRKVRIKDTGKIISLASLLEKQEQLKVLMIFSKNTE
ncbi:MAG: hypothetical protein J6B37_03990 [Clostridia bacterium]|nr:hypothetical protein [Clostridia bacterium]